MVAFRSGRCCVANKCLGDLRDSDLCASVAHTASLDTITGRTMECEPCHIRRSRVAHPNPRFFSNLR